MTSGGVQPEERPVAVVTGASGGIGRAVVDKLIADGMRVAAVDIRAAQPWCEEVCTFTCDVSDPIGVGALVTSVEKRLGRASVVVNCAGIGLWLKRVGEISAEEWNAVIGANLSGPFFVTRGFLPALVENGGSVVIISSVHGISTAPGWAAYAASKAGLFGLTKGIAVDYAEDGVRANCIVLGSVDTDMTRTYEVEARERGIFDVAIRPWQRTSPQAVADVVSFLVSREASFLNGALVPVDGGLLSCI